MISLLRIAFWPHLESDDFTYSVSLLYLFSALEPLLGIVLASLPIMRQAGVHIINSPVLSWVKSLMASSGSGSGYRREESLRLNPVSKNTESRNFHRLHDDSNLSVPGTEVEGHRVATSQVHAEHAAPKESEDKNLSPDGINVTQAYSIHSSVV